MNVFGNAFTFIVHHGSLLTSKTETHIEICLISLAISVVIAVPLGVLLGHLHEFSFLAINVSNLGRALPSLAILAILLPVFGIGHTDVIITLVILAFPPIMTNTYVAIDQVDGDAVEAAKGMGMRPYQVITRVELPLGMGLIFAGIRTSGVFVVATATLTGIFGGGGLGDIIENEPTYGRAGVIGAAYVLIVLVFIAQGLLTALERAVTPKGLGSRRARVNNLLEPIAGLDEPAEMASSAA